MNMTTTMAIPAESAEINKSKRIVDVSQRFAEIMIATLLSSGGRRRSARSEKLGLVQRRSGLIQFPRNRLKRRAMNSSVPPATGYIS